MSEIITAAFTGLMTLFTWAVFPVMMVGILIGMFLGLVPGLSGLTGLALLLPFAIGQTPEVAFALLLSMYAVTTQTDTIPAVLIGVPGTTAAMATCLDGYPMAKRGEAGRALSASYFANIFGTFVAAFIFVALLPVLRGLIVLFGAPEFFMAAMLGLLMAGSLSGNSILRGIVMAGLGLLIAMIGLAPNTGEPRFDAGFLYLWDGMPLSPFVLGIFAIPELVELAVQKSTIAQVAESDRGSRGLVAGFWDNVHHWWLIVRCSIIGAVIGIIPGLGGPVAEWFAYGHAVQSAKDPSLFGKGDIRGVIAPEAGTAAQKPGALLPTVTFSIPGNAPMALMMGVFLIVGLKPGPEMLSEHLDITFLMIWAVVLGNIIGAVLAIALQPFLVRLCYVRSSVLVPVVLGMMVLGAILATRSFGDVVLFWLVGCLGYLFKQTDWPRVPLILGVILGRIVEPELFVAVDRWGVSWLWNRPAVLIILGLILASIAIPAYRKRRRDPSGNLPDRASGNPIAGGLPAWRSATWWFGVAFVVIAAAAAAEAGKYDFRDRLLPWITSALVILFGLLHTALGLLRGHAPAKPHDVVATADKAEKRTSEILRIFLWITGILVLVILVGVEWGVPLFILIYMMAAGERFMLSAIMALSTAAFILIAIVRLMHIAFPVPYLFEWIGL